jgi:ribulose-phosphate 3-epimerase
MHRPILIEASVACANFAALGSDLDQLRAGGVDYLHIDMMDGRFVNNFGLDFGLMATIRKISDIPLDVHLMIEEPERYIDRALEMGSRYVCIHFEATHHVQKALQQIRSGGAKAGIALNPATPVSSLDYILDDIDMVTVMTVNPGAAGQRLIPAMLRKISDTRSTLEDAGRSDVQVQADGNVSFTHIPAMVAAGATMLVGGTSSIFHKDYSIAAAITRIRNLLNDAEQVQ